MCMEVGVHTLSVGNGQHPHRGAVKGPELTEPGTEKITGPG